MAASDPPTLGGRIKRARHLRRLSQEQLAAAVGVSVRTVGSWERDETEPRNIPVIEEYLGASLASSDRAEFVPADDDEARIWAMNEPEEFRRKLIDWKRRSEQRPAAAAS